jgi:ribosomal protein S8E
MLHLGQVQIGMDLPLQIAQGKSIKITSRPEFKGKVAFQIDG